MRRLAAFLWIAVCLSVTAAGLVASPAEAVESGAGWAAYPSVFPTNLPPGGQGELQISMLNVGTQPSSGAIIVTDVLPEGTRASNAGGIRPGGAEVLTPAEEEEQLGLGGARWNCTGDGSGERNIVGATTVTCTSNPAILPAIPVPPPGEPEERVGISVVAGNSSGENHVTVAGGGAAVATSTTNAVTVSEEEAKFGFSGWDVSFSGANGEADLQAGSHPYELTVFLGFNELNGEVDSTRMAGGDIRDLSVELPAGLFGNPAAVPRCTRASLDGQACPGASQIGTDSVGNYSLAGGGTRGYEVVAVYNMVPPAGVPAEFAFSVAGIHAFLDAGVRSGGGYGIVEHLNNLPRDEFDQNILTLWGVPAEASHDSQRSVDAICEENCAAGVEPKALLTLPTACAGPQAFTVHGLATWQDPLARANATTESHDNTGAGAGFAGCEKLLMAPTLVATPEQGAADSPTGFSIEVGLPQEALEVPTGVIESTIKNATATLPAGLTVNPARASGLTACSDSQANIESEGPASCPATAKVGVVNIKTPLLDGERESELKGDVYVLDSNPPNLRLLFTASADGVNLKIPARVELNESTEQLTATFTEAPELPFTEFKATMTGGPQAALATPKTCGRYETTTTLSPWATPFGEDLHPASRFEVTSAPGGGGCPSQPLPFAPSFESGATTDQAGAFTGFSLTMQDGDGQQRVGAVQVQLPPGLGAYISNVPQCPEPQASDGECGQTSEIGQAVIEAGRGPEPLVIPQPGNPPPKVFLTGPYEGAPFGLSIVTPVIAGPFNLGPNVVRARIEVDPTTAQVTATTDTQTQGHPIPLKLKGVPTDVRAINVVVNRPQFMFNPTNCATTSTLGTIGGAEGTNAPVSSRFQVGACRDLSFAPKFSATTQGNGATKGKGASLAVHIATKQGPNADPAVASEAAIAKVAVSLPLALPSRLTTLQKACLEAQFAANPAGCPPASSVGVAVAHTPELPVALEGPAYLVSHGGAAFPDLEMVLQGDGVTIILDGKTQIKKGITFSRFEAVPDAPVTSFELKLPEGQFSLLAANANLCKPTRTVTVKKTVVKREHGRKVRVRRTVTKQVPQPLEMPTTITAQNGLVVKQGTKIAVTGCPKSKPKHPKAKHARAKKGGVHTTSRRQAR
jgi:uncharacterized repeat protein (TIGR01451 family)